MIDDLSDITASAWPIWGHEHGVKELRAAVIRGPRHAYILSGFDHLGKSTIAKVFAQALLCTNPTAPGVPCLECSACQRVGRGSHPDCSFWDLERQAQTAEKSTTSRNLTLNINTVRDITSSLSMRPLESRYRIVIVDDVETMQETAQEAFLKTLEEPPAYAVILLLTSDAESLLETIRSRAMSINLQSVPTDRIRTGLLTQGVDPEKAENIAILSDGLPGWALLAAASDTLVTERVQEQTLADTWIESDRYDQLTEATRLGDVFGKNRESVFARLIAVQRQWRLRLLSALESSPDSAAAIVKALRSIDTCLNDLDANVRPKLALQNMVLQWPIINH